ncbi:acyltransferase family domain-containing protein [Hirsutella rhossiliensis]|uniref:Acyltransferase family domain-containing protein n=1 Tax=Hirsutella rhossiliensis TaxID=111463 RepID=A0A9P8MXQ5_9HYPO|nr:acyltransferase family domain-containing protein [Hirsutella rhossiliensis]KAH0964003.1 acyltransferase family domain-containing protein [Hirsutella rhossiliensis]
MVLIRLGWLYESLPTLSEQLWDWYNVLWKVTFSWNWDRFDLPPYNPNLWTIPVEFCNSLLLFITIAGLSRMKTYLRLASSIAISIYCLKCGHWAAFEFLMGMVMAEISLIQDSIPLLSSVTSRVLKYCLIGNLVFGIFIAGWPNAEADKTPGISALWFNTIEPYWGTGDGLYISFYWYSLAAVQIVAALQQIKLLQNLFVTPLAQYLGDISFAFYLVHGPIKEMVVPRGLPFLWSTVGGPDEAGMWGRMIVWCAALIVIGIPAVWAADLFWRVVDVKSVELARSIETCCTRDD